MSSYDNKHDDPKLGAKCCGCCCDMRRAVIAVNMVSIGLNILALILFLVARDIFTNEIDDDDALEILEDSYTDQAIISGVGIGILLIVIFGAVRFNKYLVGLGVLWYIAAFVAGTTLGFIAYNDFDDTYEGSEDVRPPIPSVVINGVITALFIYPHVFFMMEINKGVMSRETYPREEHSCCCT